MWRVRAVKHGDNGHTLSALYEQQLCNQGIALLEAYSLIHNNEKRLLSRSQKAAMVHVVQFNCARVHGRSCARAARPRYIMLS